MSSDQDVSFTPPSCGLASSHLGFLLGLSRKDV
jgi:hypothetical protein